MTTQKSPASAVVVDAVTDHSWRDLVAGRPTSVFHTPQWLTVLARTYGFEPQAVVSLDETGHATAGVPFCVIDGPPERRIATPPFSDYADPLVTDMPEWNALISPLLAEGCPITVRCLHNDIPPSDDRFASVDKARWHGLELAADLELVWAGLHSSARRAIRKADKEGLVVRHAQDKKELRAFFDLHLRTRKYKYRLLAQPFVFFEHIWDLFVEQDRGTILCAYAGDRLAAAVFYLDWQGTRYYKFSASNPEFVQLRPNDSLIWRGIQDAKARGLERLDFGLSDWEQEGLVRYKRKFATEEKTIRFLSHRPGPPANVAVELRRSLGPLTELLTEDAVPDAVTERAGEVLYRFFA